MEQEQVIIRKSNFKMTRNDVSYDDHEDQLETSNNQKSTKIGFKSSFLAILCHSIIYFLLLLAWYKTEILINLNLNNGDSNNLVDFLSLPVFFIIIVLYFVQIFSSILTCFTSCCCPSFLRKFARCDLFKRGQVSLSGVGFLIMLFWQLIKLNKFIINGINDSINNNDYNNSVPGTWVHDKTDDSLRLRNDFCTPIFDNEADFNEPEIHPIYVKKPVDQAISMMRLELYALFICYPLYQYLRYKFDIKYQYNRYYCWILPRILDAYLLVALDSMEFIFETRELVPCNKLFLNTGMFIVLGLSMIPLMMMLKRNNLNTTHGTGYVDEHTNKAQNRTVLPGSELLQDLIFLIFRIVALFFLFGERKKIDSDINIWKFLLHIKTTTIIFMAKNVLGLIAEGCKLFHILREEEKLREDVHLKISSGFD